MSILFHNDPIESVILENDIFKNVVILFTTFLIGFNDLDYDIDVAPRFIGLRMILYIFDNYEYIFDNTVSF
jgi:hypothetical protein